MVARVAEGLGVSWHTGNNAVLAEGHRVLIDPTRFDGVTTIGVDEHVWLGGPCTLAPICSPRSRRTGWPLCSPPRNT
jgi:hypothetical protein